MCFSRPRLDIRAFRRDHEGVGRFAKRLVLATAVVLAAAAVGGHAAEPGGFRAGAAVVDISPTNFPVIVNAMFTERSATGTVDLLHARALVLDDGSKRLAIAVVDTCMMPRELIDRAKALAGEATGIPGDHLLVSATHTHSAPSAMGCLGSRVDPAYAAFLPGRIAAAIIQADRNRVPARVGWGAVDDWDHTFNRRWIRRSDRLLNDPFGQPTVRAHMHPGHESPDAIGPSGPVDPELSVLAVRTSAGRPLAVLANYSQHYYGSPLLSSDYYGRFARHLARLLEAGPDASETPESSASGSAEPAPFVGIMSQGTSGDLMWMDYAAPRRDIGYDAYAREIAERVSGVCGAIEFHDWVPLRMAERRLALRYRVPGDERLAWARREAEALGDRLPSTQPEIYALEALHLHAQPRTELVLQALRVGELGIVAMPNEVFALTGLKLKARSPLRPTFNIELANGAEGYIPPPEQHVLGGYTTWPARTAGLEIEAEPKIVETLLGLLEDVVGQSRRETPPAHGPYAQAILASRPVAYWRLDEMTFPLARDATGRDNEATYEDGIALFLPGPGSGTGVSPIPGLTPSAFSGPKAVNRAVHFAGGRLHSRLPQLGQEYTVEFWFWNGLPSDARPVTGYLFSRGRDGDAVANGDHLGIGGTYRPGAQGRLLFFNGNAANQILAGSTPLPVRTWHHVALIRTGRTVRVHLNGHRTPEIVGTAEVTVPSRTTEIFLGGRNDRFAGLEGRIDEVALYDRALSPDEIARHFATSGLDSRPPGIRPATESDPVPPGASLNRLHVPDGFRVELVAAEPLVIDPVAIDWDAAGRLWVVEMADYPLGLDGQGKPGGRVRVLEDSDRDGQYDRSTLFADGLNFPNGLLTWRDGVLVTAAPEILFLRDTDGDGRADERRVLISGFLEGNQQLRVNGLRWGLDNRVYCAAGGHHRGHGAGTVLRSHLAHRDVPVGSRDFRFDPDTGELDPESGPSQFGRNRDDWGHWFGTQNIRPLWHYVLPDRYLRRNPHLAAPDPVHLVIRPLSPTVYPAGRLEKRYHSFNEAGHFTSACSGMIYRDNLLFPTTETLHAFACEPFHNLVHHAWVLEDGVTFAARRAPGEETSEFFASEDRWCRPVMARTGPDGALWVVDMYRYMIEHPEWLPAEGRAELLPHYREGDDRGRLYRILPADASARPIPCLAPLSTSDLVAALDSPNGWQRDKVHQLLLWRADRRAIPSLEALVRTSANPLARVHALGVLDGLRSLTPDLVQRALADPHPGVRENGVRLAETRGTTDVLAEAVRLAKDPDPKVRLQLALSLGEWDQAPAGEALGRLAVAHPDDPFLTAAALSSALPHIEALVDAALKAAPPVRARLMPPLVQLALARHQRESLARLIEPCLTPRHGGFHADQMEGFSRLWDSLHQARSTVEGLTAASGGDDHLALLLRRRGQLLAAAANLAGDALAPPLDRITAAGLLLREEARRPDAISHLSAWLSPQFDPAIQTAALGALAAIGAAEIAPPILRRWGGYSPALRRAIIDTLSSREPWAMALLEAIRSGTAVARDLDASQRTRLLRHGNPEVREQAAAAWAESITSASRAEVIAAYRPALALAGEPARGAATFERLCLSCHRRGERGHDVGPDLRSVVAHPPEKLLVNILDPSADVQPGYHAYECTLKDGEELYGVIAAETGNSVVLALTDGSRRTLRRTDIAELRGSRLSLMPEGLEAGLTQQDLADLIAWLLTPSE